MFVILFEAGYRILKLTQHNKMKKIFFQFVLLVLFFATINAQESNYQSYIEASGGYISPNHVPFWLRSNQFGSIPLDNASMSFIGAVKKDYNIKSKKKIDWGGSFEGRANIGNKSNFQLIEVYGKLKISIFEIKAGRSKEIIGLCDSSLSAGAFAVSGNALGIPKIQISIPEFYSIPIFGKLFAFKGNYAHGWIGSYIPERNEGIRDTLKTFLHQLSFYGQLGKPDWRWKLIGGINHQAQWGSEAKYYGDAYTLSDLQCYWYVITGKSYGSNDILTSKIGNHLGSIDLGFEYSFTGSRLFVYHQFFYDIGALYHLANLRDGLSGVSLTNRKSINNNTFKWRTILMEFFFSKNQAGESWSKVTPSGDENYYNNDRYVEGWSYKGIGVGNPLIGTRLWIRDELPDDPRDYFINNRIVALHFGFEGSMKKLDFILKSSYSLNYGTFGTSKEGHSLGEINDPPRYGIFPETKQLSSYIEATRALKSNLKIGLVTAFDTGDLYYNSFGLLFKVSKSF